MYPPTTKHKTKKTQLGFDVRLEKHDDNTENVKDNSPQVSHEKGEKEIRESENCSLEPKLPVYPLWTPLDTELFVPGFLLLAEETTS